MAIGFWGVIGKSCVQRNGSETFCPKIPIRVFSEDWGRFGKKKIAGLPNSVKAKQCRTRHLGQKSVPEGRIFSLNFVIGSFATKVRGSAAPSAVRSRFLRWLSAAPRGQRFEKIRNPHLAYCRKPANRPDGPMKASKTESKADFHPARQRIGEGLRAHCFHDSGT